MVSKDTLTKNIKNRIDEIAGYQINIDNYTTMLLIIPNKLPENLNKYKSTSAEDLVNILSEAEIQMISDFNFYNLISLSLTIEKLEQRKAQFVLEAMQLQLKGANYVA